MAVTFVRDVKPLVVKSPEEARKHFMEFYSKFKFLSILAGIFAFIFPPLTYAILGYLFVDYILEIHEEYFHKDKKHWYSRMLGVKVTPKHFIEFGYRLETSELERHLEKLWKMDVKYLKRMANLALKNFWNKWRLVGIDKNLLTLHLWLLGASGAGKTSTIVTALKHQAKNGGGAIMIDGKADGGAAQAQRVIDNRRI